MHVLVTQDKKKPRSNCLNKVRKPYKRPKIKRTAKGFGNNDTNS